MNLFILDYNIAANVRYHVDKHVVKIPIEATQLVSNARHHLGFPAPYRETHKHSRINLFVRSCREAYIFTCKYGIALCDEYQFRYDKIHKCKQILIDCLGDIPPLPSGRLRYHLGVSEDCISGDAVSSYRKYYRREKRHLFKWTRRPIPSFLVRHAAKVAKIYQKTQQNAR